MKKELWLTVICATLLMTSCRQVATIPPSIRPSIRPARIQACTSFCLDNGDHCVFGTNLDFPLDIGLLFVNKRNVLKTAWEPSTSGSYARWMSKYGSVTFNLAGYQLVWAGMNEASLMISSMGLTETQSPVPDERPPLVSSFWAQYQLDNHSTIEEVIASDSFVRITDNVDHFLVCDRSGECAVIEWLQGEMVAYTGASLPVKALTNNTYEDSLNALETGEYWPVEILTVFPDGPAAEAGLMAGDWITAVDGVELEGEQSLKILFSTIAQHEAGDEVIFTLQRPGKSAPFRAVVRMGSPPAEEGKFHLPDSVPSEILSFGFLPTFPGDFLSRFATAAEWVADFEPTSSEGAVSYAFEVLDTVSRDDTVWSIVFDPANLRVYFHTNKSPRVRFLDLSKLDFSCRVSVKMLDVHADLSGDISTDFWDYSHKASLDHTLNWVMERGQQDEFPLVLVEALLRGLENYPCMEGAASVEAEAGTLFEDYAPWLSPKFTWIGRAIIYLYWPVWALMSVPSLMATMWHLARRKSMSWGKQLIWAIVVVVLGPIGLLIYLLVQRNRGISEAA